MSEKLDDENAIICEDIVKIYDSGEVKTSALRGLFSKFSSGKIYLILGPSGSGKTTLLNLIGGLDTVSSGSIKVFGKEITTYSSQELESYRLSEISYILQEPVFISYLNVKENLLFAISSRNRKISDEKLQDILTTTNLSKLVNHDPDSLSGGEKQRLSVAIALALDNSIFLCDEPTGQLDVENKYLIAELLKKIQKKNSSKIFIIVSHDPLFVDYVDEILVIEDGVIKQSVERISLESQKSAQLQMDLKIDRLYKTIDKLKEEIDR